MFTTNAAENNSRISLRDYNDYFTRFLRWFNRNKQTIFENLNQAQPFFSEEPPSAAFNVFFLNQQGQCSTTVQMITKVLILPADTEQAFEIEQDDFVNVHKKLIQVKQCSIRGELRPNAVMPNVAANSAVQTYPRSGYPAPKQPILEGTSSSWITPSSEDASSEVISGSLTSLIRHNTPRHQYRASSPIPTRHYQFPSSSNATPLMVPKDSRFTPLPFHRNVSPRARKFSLQELLATKYSIVLPTVEEMCQTIETKLEADNILKQLYKKTDIHSIYASYLYLLGHNLVIYHDRGAYASVYTPDTKTLPTISVYQEGNYYYPVTPQTDIEAATGRVDLPNNYNQVDLTLNFSTSLFYKVPISGPYRHYFGEIFNPFDLERNLMCSKERYFRLYQSLDEAIHGIEPNMPCQTYLGTVAERMYNPFAPGEIIYELQGIPREVFAVLSSPNQLKQYLTGCHYREPRPHDANSAEFQINYTSLTYQGDCIVKNNISADEYSNFFTLLTSLPRYRCLNVSFPEKENFEKAMTLKKIENLLIIQLFDAIQTPPKPNVQEARKLDAELKMQNRSLRTHINEETAEIVVNDRRSILWLLRDGGKQVEETRKEAQRSTSSLRARSPLRNNSVFRTDTRTIPQPPTMIEHEKDVEKRCGTTFRER